MKSRDWISLAVALAVLVGAITAVLLFLRRRAARLEEDDWGYDEDSMYFDEEDLDDFMDDLPEDETSQEAEDIADVTAEDGEEDYGEDLGEEEDTAPAEE